MFKYFTYAAAFFAMYVASQTTLSDDLSITKAELCELGATSARKAYELFAKMEKGSPNVTREDIAEGMQQGIYTRFKNDIANDDSKIGIGIAELKRVWRDRGVRDYLADPNINPATYERNIYDVCVSHSTK